MIQRVVNFYNYIFGKIFKLNFIVLLGIRLFLLPTFFVGARSKIEGFSTTVAWFQMPTAQGGLGLPFPEILAFLATSTEVLGFIFLALGLCTRLIAIPMMFMMGVAGIMVHWQHGWYAIADKTAESTLRLNDLFIWLSQNFPGRYNYATELGDPVVLNGGIEFAVTYFIMLAVLLIYGGGRYISLDYWISRKINKNKESIVSAP